MIRKQPVRAYLNLHRGQELIRDGEGIEVADISRTLASTLQLLEHLEQQDPSKWAGWKVSITVSSERISEALCA
jgi:hypothetical protein